MFFGTRMNVFLLISLALLFMTNCTVCCLRKICQLDVLLGFYKEDVRVGPSPSLGQCAEVYQVYYSGWESDGLLSLRDLQGVSC